jgi:penicillin-insensitive murein endopeptidase
MHIPRLAAAAVSAFILFIPTVLPAADQSAKALFSAVAVPSSGAARAVGTYADGCLAGGVALPVDGPSWQVMRLSRNRNWGTPQLVSYIEKLAKDAARDGWPGLLVGDLSQPRGGPMNGGHVSHQVGLDADIWFVPMPDRVLNAGERESMSAYSLLLPGRLALDPGKWTTQYATLLKRAASYPEVARIFVSPAIKRSLCETANGDRAWLQKLRPWYGHDDHFHVRLSCPPGMATCVDQGPNPPGDGCGEELAWWFRPPPPQPPKPSAPPKQITLADLPPACTGVLTSGPGGLPVDELRLSTPLPNRRPSS